jgi:thiol-disulfide isomerase/thioredoxin
MKRVLIHTGALLLITGILLRATVLPDSASIGSLFSMDSNFTSYSAHSPVDALTQLAADYPFLNEDSLAGRTILLHVWSAESAACQQAVPHLNRIAKKWKHKPIAFIAVNADEVRTSAYATYCRSLDPSYKQVADQPELQHYFASAYGTPGADFIEWPTHIIINDRGQVVLYREGFSESAMQQLDIYLESQFLR